MAKKQQWQAGDSFLIPLNDGSFGHGQIVTTSNEAMNSLVCVLSSARHLTRPLHLQSVSRKDAIAILFVTRDFLDSGRWSLIDNSPNDWAADLINFNQLEGRGFVGVKIIGSAIIEKLMNAFHGLAPWNDFSDTRYLDSLLLSSDLKPASIIFV